ncbi:MAG: SO_0444 family Cu/Zn efflux transporter [Pseudomonadota bacterium]
MKELFIQLLNNFWILLNSIAFFILVGVIIAGVFKLFLPDSFIKKHLGQHNFVANIKAALFGIPLPLCSCSVIPFVSALKKSGASNSAIQTFLIATPITGADSILATYGVFGWVFTIYRLISSVVISLVAGLLTLMLVKEDNNNTTELNSETSSCCSNATESRLPLNIIIAKAEDKKNLLQQILAYAFDDIFKDIARALMIGLVLGALIVTFMPDNLSSFISSNLWLNYILVLLVSMPLYVCATASIPLGLSLLTAGFSPGAAFIFLTAGPATNTITMSVVLKTLGKTSLIIYLSSVLVGSLVFAYLFDSLFADSINSLLVFNASEEPAGFISNISSVLLLYLSLKYIFNKNAKIINSSGCSSGGCCGS